MLSYSLTHRRFCTMLAILPDGYSACSGGRKRLWIIYCWLVWCERKILFWLKIYDHLRPSEQADCTGDLMLVVVFSLAHLTTDLENISTFRLAYNSYFLINR